MEIRRFNKNIKTLKFLKVKWCRSTLKWNSYNYRLLNWNSKFRIRGSWFPIPIMTFPIFLVSISDSNFKIPNFYSDFDIYFNSIFDWVRIRSNVNKFRWSKLLPNPVNYHLDWDLVCTNRHRPFFILKKKPNKWSHGWILCLFQHFESCILFYVSHICITCHCWIIWW